MNAAHLNTLLKSESRRFAFSAALRSALKGRINKAQGEALGSQPFFSQDLDGRHNFPNFATRFDPFLRTVMRCAHVSNNRDLIFNTHTIMSCLGVHFALTEKEVAHFRSLPNDQARLDHLQEVIEEHYLTDEPQFAAESDKAWDAMNRALTDGQLSSRGGNYPLNHVVLGGEPLYKKADYIMSLKTPQQVQDVAAALPGMTEAEFRRRYFAIDVGDYGLPLTEEDFGYTWENFQAVRDFWLGAAAEGRHVLFTADQ